MNKKALVICAAVSVLLVAVCSLSGCKGNPDGPVFKSEFQAVLLNSGQLYFGKIEGLGKPYIILREVYYVQSAVNPANNQVQNVLVRRGKELHGPDFMVLNANSIVLIEPVGPDSQVAKLIAESRKHPE